MSIHKLRIVVAAWCLVTMVFGQALLLPWHAGAQGQVGRPPLPDGIVRLPFDGRAEITQVPGCGWHNRHNKNYDTGYNVSLESQEQNDRAFDFGLSDGTPVLAAGEGDVISTDVIGGALQVVIAHGRWENGAFVHDGVRSFYLHLQEFVDGARVGDHVQAGQLVGLSGRSGDVPPHLHFSVTVNGQAANINSLPGVPWENEHLNEDGYAICNDQARDYAIGGAVAEIPEPPAKPMPSDGESVSNSPYNRDAAVDAANRYFGDAYVLEEDDSAWYVSKVLWDAGLPMTDVWNADAASGLTDPGLLIPSISGGPGVPAAIPHDLVSYLVNNGFATSTPLDWSNDVPTGANLGDLIAYDFEGDGIIDHVAVVTGFTEDGPTVTEHSPSHQDRYWTYAMEAGMWIEEAFPDSVAYLIKL